MPVHVIIRIVVVPIMELNPVWVLTVGIRIRMDVPAIAGIYIHQRQRHVPQEEVRFINALSVTDKE